MKGYNLSRGILLMVIIFWIPAFLCVSYAEPANESSLIETVIEPTCTEPGYKEIRNPEDQTIYIEEIPATGHQFSEWKDDKNHRSQTRQCNECGHTETVRTDDISPDLLPKIHLTGSMERIGKKQKVVLEAEYTSDKLNFSCYGIMTLQGHSTYGFPKKNYTIRFYDDSAGEQKHKVSINNWRKEHKFILKANYVDLSQSRNLVASGIWREMVSSRENVSDRISMLPTQGAVEGFPVLVYLNGEFFGLYTMNLHKDDDLYQMKKEAMEALVICNAHTAAESSFRSPAVFRDDHRSDWEVEFCGTEDDDTWVKDGFNDLIKFVMQASDEEFRTSISEKLDVEAAVDYLIFIYAMGLSHSGTKDLVMLNYGDQWIPSAFDMDEAFGLDAEQYRYLQAEDFLPEKTDGRWDSGTDSLLWDRILQNFEEEIIQRYQQLRQDVLTEEHIIREIESFIGGISVRLYDEDYNLYPDRPMDDREMDIQMKQYISDRLAVLDMVLGGKKP